MELCTDMPKGLTKGRSSVKGSRDPAKLFSVITHKAFLPSRESQIVVEPLDLPLLSVVIPALNEREGIARTIESIPVARIRRLGYETEVVVVDGGSNDGTREIAAAANARVILQQRRGYGLACRTGFAAARGELIVVADADGTYPMQEIPRLIELLQTHGLDFITTDRLTNSNPRYRNRRNEAGNRLLSLWVRILFGIKLNDPESGMWLIRRRLLSQLHLESVGWPFSHELKLEAIFFSRSKWQQVPISYRFRFGETKVSNVWKTAFEDLLHITEMRFLRKYRNMIHLGFP
jgi:glycosyltransferase involved in cell wall biosynthesis